MAEQAAISPRTRLLIEDQRMEWRELDRRILAFDEEFALQARADPSARLLTTIPGIGPLNATAPVAAIGSAQTFHERIERGGGMTPHDHRTLERYSRGELSLKEACNHLGLIPSEVNQWLKEAGLPAPKRACERRPNA